MSRQPKAERATTRQRYEAETAPGLEPFTRDEVLRKLPGASCEPAFPKPGNVQIEYGGSPSDLLELRTAGSAYIVRAFDVPRPLALLGHQHLTALLEALRLVLSLHPPGSFHSFGLSAAGSDSPALRRLRAEIASATALEDAGSSGDLVLRVRRPLTGSPGFELSVRLTPRPLSVRPWRVCDRPGALNAAVARVMVELTEPRPDDVFLNLMCGSGTLLAERAECGPAASLLGADIDPEALACASRNLKSAGAAARLERWDAADMPLPDGAATALCADMPFGHLVGSHAENVVLYPAALREAARVAAIEARLVLLTSEARLMERVLAEQTSVWRQEQLLRLSLDATPLRLYVLRRRKGPAV